MTYKKCTTIVDVCIGTQRYSSHVDLSMSFSHGGEFRKATTMSLVVNYGAINVRNIKEDIYVSWYCAKNNTEIEVSMSEG